MRRRGVIGIGVDSDSDSDFSSSRGANDPLQPVGKHRGGSGSSCPFARSYTRFLLILSRAAISSTL